MKLNPKEAPKKRWHRPTIHVYGNIGALTRAVGTMGKRDNGSGKTMKSRS